MAYIHCKWKKNALFMSFKGKMTVENAGKIKKGLMMLYDKRPSAYYADFSQITEIDVAFLQLLLSFNAKIKNIGAELYILSNSLGNQLLDDLKITGIDIYSYFSSSEGN